MDHQFFPIFKTLLDNAHQRELSEGDSGLCPPISEEELKQSEKMLDFKLPEAVKQFYLQVGNGGIILPVGATILGLLNGETDGTCTGLDYYCGWREGLEVEDEEDEEDNCWDWIQGLLPFAYWGCGIYSCIDCTKDDLPMFKFYFEAYSPDIVPSEDFAMGNNSELFIYEKPFAEWLLSGSFSE